jgi:hypothetical protein
MIPTDISARSYPGVEALAEREGGVGGDQRAAAASGRLPSSHSSSALLRCVSS